MAARARYKDTFFEPNYSRTFEQFKEEFRKTKDFRKLPAKTLNQELKVAFEIATGKKSGHAKQLPEKPEKPSEEAK